MENTLNNLLTHKVAILDADTDKLTSTTTVDDLTTCFDTHITLTDTGFYLNDYQDEDNIQFLGKDIKSTLESLNEYEYFFNDYDDGWYSDFMYYYNEEQPS